MNASCCQGLTCDLLSDAGVGIAGGDRARQGTTALQVILQQRGWRHHHRPRAHVRPHRRPHGAQVRGVTKIFSTEL